MESQPAGWKGKLLIVRAGEVAYGLGPAAPILGWRSPTYSVREPALSIAYSVHTFAPLVLRTQWTFIPKQGSESCIFF